MTRCRATSTILATLLVAGPALGEPSPSAADAGSPPFIEVASDSSCPASDSVAELLRQILGLYSGEHVDEVAELVHDEGQLVVRLRGRDRRLLGERKLPSGDACEELARATAVVLASWLSEAHPELVPPPAGPRETPAVAAAVPTPPPLPAEVPVPVSNVRSAGRVLPIDQLRFRPSASIGVALVPTPPAVAGFASLALVPDGSGFGGAVRAGAVASRAVDVPGGSARYRRWPLELTAVLRFAGGAVSGELEAGAAIGWLAVEGRSFEPNRSANDATFGPAAAARLIGSRGSARPFVELTGLYWAKVARVYGDPAKPNVVLPALDLTLAVGVAALP